MLLHSGVAQAWETDARGSRRLMYLYAGRCGSAAPEEDTLEPVVVEPEPLPRSPTLAPLSRRDSGSEVELRSIIGGSALIDRELLGRPYPNEVVLARRSVTPAPKKPPCRARATVTVPTRTLTPRHRGGRRPSSPLPAFADLRRVASGGAAAGFSARPPPRPGPAPPHHSKPLPSAAPGDGLEQGGRGGGAQHPLPRTGAQGEAAPSHGSLQHGPHFPQAPPPPAATFRRPPPPPPPAATAAARRH